MANKSVNVLALGPPPITTSIEIVWLQEAEAGPVTLSSKGVSTSGLTVIIKSTGSAAQTPSTAVTVTVRTCCNGSSCATNPGISGFAPVALPSARPMPCGAETVQLYTVDGLLGIELSATAGTKSLPETTMSDKGLMVRPGSTEANIKLPTGVMPMSLKFMSMADKPVGLPVMSRLGVPVSTFI